MLFPRRLARFRNCFDNSPRRNPTRERGRESIDVRPCSLKLHTFESRSDGST